MKVLKNQKGFTLIEMMIVLLVISVLLIDYSSKCDKK